nr:hypothetical protein [Mesorhizobium sp.]
MLIGVVDKGDDVGQLLPLNSICSPSSCLCISIIAGAPAHIRAVNSNGFIIGGIVDASNAGASSPPMPLTE